MEDNIDINEHDVLDNPLVKSLFPDLSKVKMEVEDPEIEDTQNIEIEENSLSNPCASNSMGFKISLNETSDDLSVQSPGPPSTTTQEVEESPQRNNMEKLSLNNTNEHTFGKIIIKTEPTEIALENFTISDIGAQDNSEIISEIAEHDFVDVYIIKRENSPDVNMRDLTEGISFSNDLINQPLESVTTSQETEEFGYENRIVLDSKSPHNDVNNSDVDMGEVIVYIEDCGPYLEGSDCYCKTCKILYPNSSALDAHKTAVHSLLIVAQNFSKNVAVKSTSKSAVTDNKSYHSNSIHTSLKAQVEHFSNEELAKRYEFLTSRKNLKVNAENWASNTKKCFYRCPICTCYYRNRLKFGRHMVFYHKQVNYEKSVSKFVDKCPFCEMKYTFIWYNRHISTEHRAMLFMNYSEYHKLTPKRIPRKTPKPCSIKRPLYKCTICSSTFTKHKNFKVHNTKIHRKIRAQYTIIRAKADGQHAPTQAPPRVKLAVQYTKNVLHAIPESVLFKCYKCTIHFLSCFTACQHSKKCSNKMCDTVKCDQCNIVFKSSDFIRHKSQHAFTEKFSVLSNQDSLLLKLLCRCSKCTLYFDEVTLRKHQYFCNENSPSTFCKKCKVYIDERSVYLHNKKHKYKIVDKFIKVNYIIPDMFVKCKEEQADLHDGMDAPTKNFKYKQTIGTSNKINAPLPNFLKCSRCGVLLHHGLKEIKHNCVTDECVTCEICTCKYTRKAYDLHLTLNERCGSTVSQTEEMLIKKYRCLEGIWNVLYMCEPCDLVTDSYDRTIEHSQWHYSKTDNIKTMVKKCTRCNLTFDTTSFEKHERLHSNNKSINRDSFKILKYSFASLLSDDWFKVFNSLPRVQVEQIMSHSIYEPTRCVKMWLVKDGPAKRTLYRCNTCKNCVNSESVAHHAMNNHCCSKILRSHPCSMCGIAFFSRKDRDRHEPSHATFSDNIENPFRIVVFDNRIDSDKIKPIKRKIVDDDVQFNGITPGAGVSKRKKSKNVSQLNESDCETEDRLAKIYKCRCGLHFTSLNTIQKHFESCGVNDETSKKNCSKCGLLFPIDLLVSHLCSHHTNKYNGFAIEEVPINSKRKDHAYKCLSCHLSFSTKGNLKRHSSTCKLVDYRKSGNSKSKEVATTAEFVVKKETEKLVVFKCQICDLCFLTLSSLRSHVDRYYKEGKVSLNTQNVPCQECGLTFSGRSIVRHMTIHHKNDNYTQDDFELQSIDMETNKVIVLNQIKAEKTKVISTKAKKAVVKRKKVSAKKQKLVVKKETTPNIDGNSNESNAVDSQIKEDNHEADSNAEQLVSEEIDANVSSVSTSMGLETTEIKHDNYSENTNLDDTVDSLEDDNNSLKEQFSSREVKIESSTEDKNLDESCESMSKSNNIYKHLFKLYKCSECNVYFLYERTCRRHATRHVPFDIKDYIECKLCGLQFTYHSLCKHVKKHHKNDVKLEYVFAEQCQPPQTPNIEIYYAIEGIQSRQVTTTTGANSDLVQEK